MATNSNTGRGWGWFGMIVVIALLGAGYLYQREGGRIFGPNVQRENAEQATPSDKRSSGNEPKGEPRTADPKPAEPKSEVGAVEVSLVQDEREVCRYADWRLYVDGRIVVGKAEPFRWFVNPSGDSCSIVDDSGLPLLHVSKDGSTQWPANREVTVAQHKLPLANGVHKLELVYRVIVVNHRGEIVPGFP